MRSGFAGFIALACFTAAISSAHAQGVADSLTLAEAVRTTVAQHPQLAGFVFELRAEEASLAEATLRPAPQLEALVEDAAGTGERRGLSTAQTTLSLSQLIELGGKREGRADVARAGEGRIRTEQAARQLDVLAEVARRFYATLSLQAEMQIIEEGVRLAERTQAAVVARVKAARSPEAEQARAEVRVSRLYLELEDAQHELQSARYRLASAMGQHDVTFERTAGELLTLPPAKPFVALMAQVEQTPDFLRFADEARLRDAQLRLALATKRADIRINAGARRYEDTDDVALVLGFSVPLYSARHAKPQIDTLQAQQGLIATQRESSLLAVRAQLFAEYQQMQHARHETAALRESIIPQLEKALQLTEYAYERGRYSYLEWTDAQSELIDARRQLIDAATRFHTARVEIERLTGESLTTAGDAR